MQNGAKFPGIRAGIFLKTYSWEFPNGNSRWPWTMTVNSSKRYSSVDELCIFGPEGLGMARADWLPDFVYVG